ncbi:MAG TPA: protein phosphatase, partial [Deltaproteobacteria bacterium]|nr:protein phosphatase [Deltaproteobacteria bacterium]
LRVAPGDVFLLCSDGLNDMVDGRDIELLLESLAQRLPMAAAQLVMVARDCRGHDNVTVALVRIEASFARAGRSLLARLFDWLRGRSAA